MSKDNEQKVETDHEKGMRGITDDEYIIMVIKAKDTEDNQAVHSAFREFSKLETKNDYTLGLRRLLENYEYDYKLEMMHDKICMLESKIMELQKVIEKPDEEDDEKEGMF